MVIGGKGVLDGRVYYLGGVRDEDVILDGIF